MHKLNTLVQVVAGQVNQLSVARIVRMVQFIVRNVTILERCRKFDRRAAVMGIKQPQNKKFVRHVMVVDMCHQPSKRRVLAEEVRCLRVLRKARFT